MCNPAVSAVFLLLAIGSRPSFAKVATSALELSPRCGEVLTNSNGGSVSYKPYEPVLSNERCVWIIAAPQALGYTIDVLHLGSPTNEPESLQQLVITGIELNKGSSWGDQSNEHIYPPFLDIQKPTTVGTITFNSSNLVVITFASEVGDGTGFAIQYKETLAGDGQTVSLNTTHHIVENPTFDFIYPRHGGIFDINELATLVFIPRNNTFSDEKTLLSFKGTGGTPKGCADSIYVYNYDSRLLDTKSIWNYVARGCMGINRLEVGNNDFTLVLFKSDEAAVGPAFRFHFVGCPI